MGYPSEAEAKHKIAKLKMGYQMEILDLLAARERNPEIIEAYATILADASDLSDYEIERLKGTPEGDAIANTIIKIQVMDTLMLPKRAGGWRKGVRIAVTICLMAAGWLSAPHYTLPFGGILGVGIGFIVAVVFGYFQLGGRPETRHALAALTTSQSQRNYAALSRLAGPSPHGASLLRLQDSSDIDG